MLINVVDEQIAKGLYHKYCDMIILYNTLHNFPAGINEVFPILILTMELAVMMGSSFFGKPSCN